MNPKSKTLDQIKVISLKHNDTVVVRKWDGITKEDREAITKSLTGKANRQRLHGITLLWVDKFSDVRIMNEQQMKGNGWVRDNG